MRLPSSVRIAQFTYEVLECDSAVLSEFIEEEPRELGVELAGICIPNQLKIFITNGLPIPRQQEVLWHEVSHAVQDLSGLNGNMETTNEDAIGSLITLQLMVMHDNPELVSFLTYDSGTGAEK